ncbi:uncharacterized protein LOC119084041 [Bradysia coprophila]|nr:uncharacterized protein LOC119084041 [Bradysia coprophila]
MFVQTSDQKGKKLCCPFCWKLVCKLSRHVTTIHKDEEQVQKLVAIPQGGEFNKERWNIQNAIQTAGLLRWNTDRTINTSGILIVPRRPHPSLNRMATDFLICPNCTSFHSITNLRNHFTRCTNGKMKGTRNIKILARAVEGRLSNEASEQLKEVIPVMKEDEIVRLIRYDWLLIAYGNILCMKYSFHFQQNMIRAKLRLAGRVLHAFKKINPEVTNFASIFYPKHYKTLIEAINAVGKFNPATNEFGAPATSASAITSVKQIGSVLKCEYIQREKSEHVKRTDDFLFLMESQYTSIINKRVKESQLVKKRMKDHKIPSNEDVRLFSLYVNREREKYLKELSANYSLKNWVKLSELTIASIIVFNRRRTGESQNIHVCDFNHCESVNETSNEALFTSLSEKAKEVVRLFSRMKVRGKKGVINVSVLLQADVTSCIKLLLSHRLEAGIPSHNPYLFALPSPPGEKRIRVINSCKVLATLSTLCGAKDPSTLRGTNLRKHFATACMAKELNDDMVGEVAKFMGHRESVHRENYRHNTVDREIVKIVELLLAAQGNVQDEDDVSDSDSDSESEDITMLNPALRVVPKKRGSANKNKIAVTPSSLKRKVNEKVQPRKLLVNGSKSARQIGQKRMGSEGGEKAGGKRIKKEGKERSTKNSVGSAISALSARQKCMRTEGAKQPEKSVRKRVKVKGKERPEKKSGAGRKINTNTSFQISTTDKSSANH